MSENLRSIMNLRRLSRHVDFHCDRSPVLRWARAAIVAAAGSSGDGENHDTHGCVEPPLLVKGLPGLFHRRRPSLRRRIRSHLVRDGANNNRGILGAGLIEGRDDRRLENARVGDAVLLFGEDAGIGKDSRTRLPASETAAAADTISYELLTLVGRMCRDRRWIEVGEG